MPKKVLIANRGEIALRILRSVRESGMSPVALYSEIDRGAPHVRLADEAYELGPAPASESYLNVKKILKIAKECKAFAIHPGYGFLSENAAFAKEVEKNGFKFIGPSPRSIALMGDKLESRKVAKKAGVPMVDASGPLKDCRQAQDEAKKLGYPVLLKARAGGGGKGMRKVFKKEELEEAYRLAQSEAEKSFANSTLYLEKYVVRPRHIEVQIFGDRHGNVLALGDRECSIQRRHQKIIEEAPAPNLSDQTRRRMATAARALASAVEYEGAGTIEFLVDQEERFFFLEMNTRLQVEHPVTEWVTGLDLVAWQLLVIEGEPLPLGQDEIALVGHSIEVRLYAEDPKNGFAPAPGTIRALQWPTGPGIRVDSGVEIGSEISLYYDPMVAKLSVWGENRKQALTRIARAMHELRIGGIRTNSVFLEGLIRHPLFQKGKLTTTFVQDEGPFPEMKPDHRDLDVALAALALSQREEKTKNPEPGEDSLWWKNGLPRIREDFYR